MQFLSFDKIYSFNDTFHNVIHFAMYKVSGKSFVLSKKGLPFRVWQCFLKSDNKTRSMSWRSLCIIGAYFNPSRSVNMLFGYTLLDSTNYVFFWRYWSLMAYKTKYILWYLTNGINQSLLQTSVGSSICREVRAFPGILNRYSYYFLLSFLNSEPNIYI